MNVRGRRILVTGGTGFLGRYVVTELRAAGAEVVAVGRRDYDLRRRECIVELLADVRPAAVVHLAAVVGGIAANQAEPGRFFYENAVMGIELVEACRKAGTEKVVLAGTVCAYPEHTKTPFAEDDLWDGYPEPTNAPYALAKKMLLVQAQAYRDQYGMNIVYLLPVNLYGPGDDVDLDSCHVVPAMIRKFVEARGRGDRSVVLWGTGSPTRELLHVRDAARGFRLALERYDRREPVNLGTGVEISIRDLAGMVARAVGFDGRIVWDATRPDGQRRRRVDISRAKELFGFEAEVALDAGIRETVRWFESTRPADHAAS
jgi:GDP-L-fucose synthase